MTRAALCWRHGIGGRLKLCFMDESNTMQEARKLPCAQELVEGPWRHNNLDAGAAMVIPVPQPLGGAVVVGEAVVTYIDGAQPAKSVPLKSTIVRVRARPHATWSTRA